MQTYWSLPTRWLHIGLALTVTVQLFISLIMEPPIHKDASALAHGAYQVHEAVGLAAVAVVLAHWLWTALAGADGGLAHLFPWRGAAFAAVKADIAALMNRRLPDGGPRGGLPGLVHGLGFLAVSGMAATGAVLFAIFPDTGRPGPIAHFFKEVHEFLSNFVWAYWYGHVGMAVLHKWSGHATVKAMFRLGA
jgi:cytochrome b561